ncbi:MAG TPA: hypothetical protein VGE59_03120 [Patescibacteria group bacterium]
MGEMHESHTPEEAEKWEFNSTLTRHLPRDNKFEITQEGPEAAQEAARELAEHIRTLPDRSVITIVPSIVFRNKETRRHYEETLATELAEDSDIEFLPVKSEDGTPNSEYRETFMQTVEESDKKIIVTGIQPQTLLGYRHDHETLPDNEALSGFVYLLGELQGSEELVGKLWMCDASEFPALAQEIESRLPGVDTTKLTPGEIALTPEDFAKNYIQFLHRFYEIAKKHFPTRPFYAVNITHDFYSDFTTMAAMGKPINLQSLQEFGGSFRDFLESSEISFDGESVTTTYRGETITAPKTFKEIIEELSIASESRKEMWAEHFPAPHEQLDSSSEETESAQS